MKSLFKKIIISFLILIMLPVEVLAKEFNYWGDSDRELYMRGKTIDMNIPYITVDDMQAYCGEFVKKVPHGVGYSKADGRVEYDSPGIFSIIYNGFPKNVSHLQEKYNLTDDDALMLTQYALWNYIEGWNREDATEPYAKELLEMADRGEAEVEEFKLDENNLFYKEKDEFLETDFITLNGENGKFIIKPDQGTKVYDESGRERYNYESGEKFRVKNLSRKKEDSNITITGSYDAPDLEIYEPEDSKYQDLVRAGMQSRAVNANYTIHVLTGRERGIVQTGDREVVYLFIIILGCAVYIILNMDLTKKYR